MTANEIAGTGQHSHAVPTVPGLVVEMHVSRHEGCAVWLRREGGPYVFVDYTRARVEHAPRCVLLVGYVFRADDSLIGNHPFAWDFDSPRGLLLVGVDLDDDLTWCARAGAEVLWDSHA